LLFRGTETHKDHRQQKMAYLDITKKQGSDKMGEVRKQVTTLLGAAQQGELPQLKKFLDDFAAEQLECERKGFGLGPGDLSDDDDYPEGHFKVPYNHSHQLRSNVCCL